MTDVKSSLAAPLYQICTHVQPPKYTTVSTISLTGRKQGENTNTKHTYRACTPIITTM